MNSERKAVSLGFATNTLLRRTKKSGAVEVAYHLTWKKSPERRKKTKTKEKVPLMSNCLLHCYGMVLLERELDPFFTTRPTQSQSL